MRVMALEQDQENSRFTAGCSTQCLRSTEQQVSATTLRRKTFYQTGNVTDLKKEKMSKQKIKIRGIRKK
ncbi:hypothetical protein J4457_02560 [Candidatus Woesearchaeota archaeon]|nr:hypothetical protein [Candidatus Woesearchaeota archaeon]